MHRLIIGKKNKTKQKRKQIERKQINPEHKTVTYISNTEYSVLFESLHFGLYFSRSAEKHVCLCFEKRCCNILNEIVNKTVDGYIRNRFMLSFNGQTRAFVRS